MENRAEDQSVKGDFKTLRSALRELNQVYNPRDENLHFASLEKADYQLYSKLLALAQAGLATVRRHRDYLLGRSLYADDMFWYDLFLTISAAASRVMGDQSQAGIPHKTVEELVLVLVDISEFSTVCGGDITKRNHEALGNSLLAFYSEDLVELVRHRSGESGLKRVGEFVEWTIVRAQEVRKERTGEEAG